MVSLPETVSSQPPEGRQQSAVSLSRRPSAVSSESLPKAVSSQQSVVSRQSSVVSRSEVVCQVGFTVNPSARDERVPKWLALPRSRLLVTAPREFSEVAQLSKTIPRPTTSRRCGKRSRQGVVKGPIKQ